MSDFITFSSRVRVIVCSDSSMPHFHSERAPLRHGSFPSTDIFMDDNSLHIYAELAGVRLEDISVYIYSGFLVIEGVKARDTNEKGRYNFVRLERYFCEFRRVFELPFNVGSYEAGLKDGILHIFLLP